jgi:hypothetical protein
MLNAVQQMQPPPALLAWQRRPSARRSHAQPLTAVVIELK